MKASHGVAGLAFISLLYSIGFGLVLFLLPFMAYEVSGSVLAVGLLVAVPALASMFTAIPAGNFADAYGRKTVVLAGLSLMVLLMLCLPYCSTLAGFLFFAFFFGVASQLIYASIKVHLFDITDSASKHFGVVATAFQAGLGLGPLVGGYLIINSLEAGLASASNLFAIDLLLVALFFLFFRFSESKVTSKLKLNLKDFIFGGIREYMKLGRVGVTVLWLTIMFTTYEGLVWTLEPLFNKYYGLDSFTTGLIMSMFILPFILFNIPAGILADRYGKMKVLVPGLITAGFFMILFGLARDTPLLIVFAFLSTAGLAFAWISLSGLLADASRKSKKGGIIGVWNTSEELGYLAGPILGGLVAQYSGIRMPFITLGILMILSTLLIKRMHLYDKK
ncbi:MAG: MFS transporter [Candidatus Altiarchaeota archaeon]